MVAVSLRETTLFPTRECFDHDDLMGWHALVAQLREHVSVDDHAYAAARRRNAAPKPSVIAHESHSASSPANTPALYWK
jgi:hypothetical protein